MKTFPRPLTTEEEKDYLERYRNGDLKAKDVLILSLIHISEPTRP